MTFANLTEPFVAPSSNIVAEFTVQLSILKMLSDFFSCFFFLIEIEKRKHRRFCATYLASAILSLIFDNQLKRAFKVFYTLLFAPNINQIFDILRVIFFRIVDFMWSTESPVSNELFIRCHPVSWLNIFCIGTFYRNKISIIL